MSSASQPPAKPGEELVVPAAPLQVAAAMLASEPGIDGCFELAEAGLLGLRTSAGRVALLDSSPEEAQRSAANLERIRRGFYPARHVVLLGGGAPLRRQLEAAAARLVSEKRWLLHTDAHEPPWQNRKPSYGERRLTGALQRSAEGAFARSSWSPSEAAQLFGRIERDLARTRQDGRDLDRFRALSRARVPIVTHVLVASIGAVFALQYLWGGVDLPPLLRSMGSLVAERVRAGEWWRYFSCTFLHGGLLHAALNTLVLWLLGRSLERFIGPARFMLIYFSAGLSGSLLSSWFISSQSVGASGAIWGLLGAEAAMAFYPRPLLPPPLVSVARRSAAANLGLNLINSFNPHVDFAAHIGGGLMGAGVLVLLAATGRLSTNGRAPARAGLGLWLGAGLLALTFSVGLGTAIVRGKPWTLAASPELERVVLPDSAWSVEVPRDRSAPAEEDGSMSFGNLAFDASVVDVSWASLPASARRADALEELQLVRERLVQAPEGLEVLVAPRVVGEDASSERLGPHVNVRYRYVANPEVINERVIGIVDATLVRVDVIAWAALPGAYDGLAARVLGSFRQADE
jgi:membrane associated rhomboid family serine protease